MPAYGAHAPTAAVVDPPAPADDAAAAPDVMAPAPATPAPNLSPLLYELYA